MTVVDLYIIQIVRDPIIWRRGYDTDTVDKIMAEIEENITDLLLAGYTAKIRRWDDNRDEEETDDDDS